MGPTSDFPVKLGKHVPKKRLIHISTRYGHSDSVYVLTHRDYSILKTNQMYITAHPINTKAFLQVSHSSVRPLDAVIDCRYAWLDRIETAFTSHKLPGNSIGISHYCKRMISQKEKANMRRQLHTRPLSQKLHPWASFANRWIAAHWQGPGIMYITTRFPPAHGQSIAPSFP